MKKILVRIPQWLGDAVVSTIFLTRLKARHPDDEIHVLTKPGFSPIFKAHPAVTNVLELPKTYSWQVFSVAKQIGALGFDTIYVLPRSARTTCEARLSGIPNRIGFGGDIRHFFFTQTASYDKSRRYPNRYLRLIGEEERSLDSLQPVFPKATLSFEEILQRLGRKNEPYQKPVLGLAPLSIAPARTWPAERFVELARLFQKEKGGTIILIGARNERESLGMMKSKIGGPVFCDAGNLTFPEVGALLSGLSCLVGNDSGLLHVASAFAVPTVAIFGASNPNVALPVSPNMKAVQHPDISCVPCLRNHCVRLGSLYNECLKTVTVAEVWKELCGLPWRN